MGALLDEMACLTRDFMVIKTAPAEGISMLSGVASDAEVKQLSQQFSNGELVRMMGLIQQTAAGFTKSTSRRMDVELCLVNLCQPELALDPEALNARITRIEDQLRSGSFTVNAPVQQARTQEEYPPAPTDADVPPEMGQELPQSQEPVNDAPIGFWVDLAEQIKSALKPPLSGFFVTTPNPPVQGVLQGDRLVLLCANQFAMDMINKPEVLMLVSQKASAKLGRQIKTIVADKNAGIQNDKQMERLLEFGRNHSDIIRIKQN